MTTEESNKNLVRRWFEELWNQKHPAIIEELLTSETQAHGMGPHGKTLIGPQPFREAYELFTGAFPDVSITIDQMVAEGDWVAVHLTCYATHTGDQLGIPATGNPITFRAATMTRIENGKILEGYNLIDLLPVFNQSKAISYADALP